MKNKLFFGWVLLTLVLVALPTTALALDSPVGVSYRGHIQDRGDYPLDGSWITSPEIIGTTGQSKRIEGFEIKLTGEIPAGMELRYNVHVQNKGWLYDENDSVNWPKDGAYAGTRGDSLRIEAVKIVLTDSEGNAVPGYAVQYRGHVQNIGDLPKDQSEWLADGAQLGTVGSSLRLEALLVQVVKTAVDPPEPAEPVVYDQAGNYGPTTGTETIAGDVTVAADGVKLQNLMIEGNLTISAAVGDGTVTLNNVTVKGDTFVRGGGKNSIHINGGQYRRIVMEKTASGAVRIIATDVDGLAVVVSEDASGETIILEGAFASVVVNAPNMTVTTQGNTTTIGKLTVGAEAAGATLNLANGTTVTDLVLSGKAAAVKGQGTVTRAEVNADSAVFEKAPGSYAVESDVVIPPVFPTPDSGGGGGSYTPTQTAVTFNIPDGEVAMPASVTLTATGADAIYYTTDGSNPSTVSGAPNTFKVSGDSATITVDQAMTVKALAARSGYYNSAVTSAIYTRIPSADLTGISISPTTANYSFAPGTYDYPDVTVANDVEAIYITPSGSGDITVDGTPVTSGSASQLIAVSFNIEKTIIVTTQEAGKALKTYTIKLTPSSGTVTPIVSTLLTGYTATSTTLDINNSDIFGIKPGSSGVLSNIDFTSGDPSVIAANPMSDGIIPILKDGTTVLNFTEASVILGGTTYTNISLNNAAITVTVTTYLNKVNGGAATVEDYANAGITGVVYGNLAGINAAVVAARDAAPGAALDKAAVQAVVDGYLATANTFAVDFYNGDTIIQNEPFNLRFTDATNGFGYPLTGTRSISLSSNIEGVSTIFGVNLTGGTALVPVTLSKIGDHSFEVTVDGMSSSQVLSATVYSQLQYDANAANGVSGYDVANGLNVAIPPDNHGTDVTVIGNAAFISKGLTSVLFPNKLTSIGVDAFMGNNLSSVTLPNSLTSIGVGAFTNNILSSVTLPPNLGKIEANAFAYNSLTQITIGTDVTIEPGLYGASTMGFYGDDFVSCYENNAKAAGTYKYITGAWTKVV